MTTLEHTTYDESAFKCQRFEYKDYYETQLILWDYSVLHVMETVDEIQSKISDSINSVKRAEIEILKDVFS